MIERIGLTLRAGLYLGVEAEGFVSQTLFDNLLEPDECSAANEKDVCGVDRKEFLMRMFASALRRHVGNSPFQDFQKGLLHALAGNVASDRRVFVLAANLVDLIDVDDALLRSFHVAVRGLQQLEDYVLDIFTD